MRPPRCAICDKRFDPGEGGDIIYFKERESDIKWRERMKAEGKVGHPPNAEWFCAEHLEEAKKLASLPINEAFEKLRQIFKY
ncbi:MAG: hypothetical protein ACTSVI_12240 [Promethearchaeota archaeon]